MSAKTIIFAVDDDLQVLRSVAADLRSRYKQDYRIMSTTSANEALDTLKDLKKQGENIALLLSDQRMREMLGVDFLAQATTIYPNAKRVLLTAYSDIDAAIRAINDIQLDYYLNKPWDPPEEKLYPVLDDLLEEWQANAVPEYSGLKIIGKQYMAQTHQIKDFLAGNLYPYQWIDVERNERADEFIKLFDLDAAQFPAVILPDGKVLSKPDLTALGQAIGLQPKAQHDLYDVVIIGAGPAGLAAAVYGGSEGLKTAVVERKAPGGQAGTSSRIENYLGFPKGLSGAELSRRAVTQASRFGVEILSPQQVEGIELSGQYKQLHLAGGQVINTKAIVICTGVDYRLLPAKGAEALTGAGIYYGAATTEANACSNKIVYVVGGGNSAGQAAMYLSKFASKVNIVIRKPDLTSSMSAYLIDQIAGESNIEVLPFAEVTETFGETQLSHINVKDVRTGEVEKMQADALFIFIGAKPYTQWVPEQVLRDEKGFLLTGRDLFGSELFYRSWKLPREPFSLETIVPGIFAAGDVRSGAMNRVASAVGEGAMSISFVHKYLAEF